MPALYRMSRILLALLVSLGTIRCASAPRSKAPVQEPVMEQGSGILDVYTTSPSGPLAGATVTARQGRLEAKSGISDKAGRCRLELVPGEKYVITVTMAGFHPRAVPGVDVVSHQITTARVLLRPKRNDPPR